MAEVSFGEWLKRRRSALGLTQEQLALQINCSTSALRKFESEERHPSAEVVEQLANIFNIPQEERQSFLRFARGDWQAFAGTDFEEAPWLVSRAATRSNLPASTTSFIGREKEQNEIKNLIAKNRLVTLTGAGGIGKTRLSIQTTSELMNEFPNGIWLVELAPLSDPSLLPQAIVNALGLIEQAGRSPINILTHFLQMKRALLILDNCEHLIQACAQLTDELLRSCSDLHLLCTSREALGITGETLYHVPTLTTPDLIHSTPEALSQYEAVQLFIERAQSGLPGFSLTQSNALAVANICLHLDGIPLALELAAARVRGLSVDQIAARLNDRFHLLTNGVRTVLPRHQTLQALIDWSHELLTKPEQTLLRRLSIFAGGWTLEAAETVCAGDGLESNQILDLLLRLVDKSLVVAETQKDESRYHMLETIRQYAHEKLWQADEGELIRQRHLTYFVDLAEQAEPNLRAFHAVMWLDRLDAELDNIRLALGWAVESDVEAQLRIASALLWFWWIRSHRNEGVDWLERGLSIEATERGDQPLIPSRAMIRGKTLNATGTLRGELAMGKAEAYFEESLKLFKELGSTGKQGMAYALLGLGGWTGLVETKEKADLQKQSLNLLQEVRDKFGMAQCLAAIANGARLRGELERARSIGEEHLALRKEIGDKDGIAIAQAHLGLTVWRQGNLQYAKELYEESLAGFRELGNIRFVGAVLSWLSNLAQEQSDHEQATRTLQEALALAQNEGEMLEIAPRLIDLGNLACAQGNYKLAAQKFREALIMSQKIENKLGICFALHGLGRVAQYEEDYNGADSFYSESVVLGREINSSWIVARNLSTFAVLAVAQKKPEQAARLFGAAETLIPSIRLEISAAERAEHDQAIAATRAALGEETFAAAWAEGKKMTLDEAIKFALEAN